jgi:ADP-ribosyl-[dinitrogen reductase] hydrolase
VGDTDDGIAATHGLIILPIGQSNQGMNRMTYTSHTLPLRIDDVDIPGVPGTIGITLCPGKVQSGAVSGSWERDLQIEMQLVKSWGATAWLNLLTTTEMLDLKVGNLEVAVKGSGIADTDR